MITISGIAGILLAVVSPVGSGDGAAPAAWVGGLLAVGGVDAPELRSVDAWLNTDKPLDMQDLRGQVVVINFWTYSCINCMHVLPDMKYLADKYQAEPFVVVGIHSGKFNEEKAPRNIRQAVLRHNIAYPVAVDSDYEVWESFGVGAWPTLVLIDPEGKVAWRTSGEGHREELDQKIAALLAEHRKKGTLGRPMTFRRERESFKTDVLEFPGKVLADGPGRRLFISDTNHHRVLVADLDGRVRQVVGSGEIGLADGRAEKARFHQPQGLAVSDDGRTLFVADTENHAIRAVDLSSWQVTTIAGTGKQGYDYAADGPAEKTALSSPWDLLRLGDKVYVAMAGTHQVWVVDVRTRRAAAFAGTGRKGGTDGPNRRATFAQPSGLASDGLRLYVADAEISSIRAVPFATEDETTTVAGSGGLFAFGSRDAVGGAARFQHPLGVALRGDKLFVADTFNHSIRLIDLKTRDVETWLGTGRPEAGTDAEIGFYEPGGLSVLGDVLYIADTNNHRIVAVDIKTKRPRVLKVTLEAVPRMLSE